MRAAEGAERHDPVDPGGRGAVHVHDPPAQARKRLYIAGPDPRLGGAPSPRFGM
jgi:hypothetical protein